MNNIYDSYENIKLLELHPNQNKEYHPSLNYGYDGLDITNNFDHKIYDFLFKDYKDRFISIGNESIGETIKDWLIKFWKWLKEKLIKFKNWIINLIKKSIDYLKRLLFRFQSENNNIKHTLNHISKESIKRRNKEILNDLITYVNNNIINKKGLEDYPNKENLELIPLQDTEALIKLSKDIQNEQTITKILYSHLSVFSSSAILNDENISHLTMNINIFEYAKNNGILNLDKYNLSDTTKNYLYNKKDNLISKNSNPEIIIKTIVGEDLLSLLINNPSKENILKLVKTLNNYITSLESSYSSFLKLNSSDANINKLNTIITNITNRLKKDYPSVFQSKPTDTEYTLDDGTIENKRINYILQGIDTLIEDIYLLVPILFARNVIIVMPFLNHFLRSIINKYSKIISNEQIELISFNLDKSNILNKVPVYKKINEINAYKASDIIKQVCESTSIYEDAEYLILTNNDCSACISLQGMETEPIIIISDGLIDYLKNDKLIDTVLYHEYGHYYYTHVAKYLKNTIIDLLNGKPILQNNRNLHDELQADLYAIKCSSIDLVKNMLQKFLSIVKIKNEILLRIKFCDEYKNNNISIEDFIKKYT